MYFTFYKYQGAGNDFVIFDNRKNTFPKEKTNIIANICDRHFGIGADGIILLENDTSSDFGMTYYNSDGAESSMCGNGGRCIVAFAKKLNIITDKTIFNAIDGLHEATISNDMVSLKMKDVDTVNVKEDFVFLNTGSPHHVEMVNDLANYPVFKRGKAIRNKLYAKEGSNINFVEPESQNSFRVRTYERGVEDETLACGTGVTAVAIAMHKCNITTDKNIQLFVTGGKLEVTFDVDHSSYKNIMLSGPATFVFEGIIKL
ncbi:MAG: diaminopimelate epimerase [Flavobacteriaceae bacterium]|nr:MAG: diaminopimelate epimerase [Flavobacteriaceae bacterium]